MKISEKMFNRVAKQLMTEARDKKQINPLYVQLAEWLTKPTSPIYSHMLEKSAEDMILEKTCNLGVLERREWRLINYYAWFIMGYLVCQNAHDELDAMIKQGEPKDATPIQ